MTPLTESEIHHALTLTAIRRGCRRKKSDGRLIMVALLSTPVLLMLLPIVWRLGGWVGIGLLAVWVVVAGLVIAAVMAVPETPERGKL